MKCKLYKGDGYNFVGEVDINSSSDKPPILIWGERLFKWVDTEGEIFIYFEVNSYVITEEVIR